MNAAPHQAQFVAVRQSLFSFPVECEKGGYQRELVSVEKKRNIMMGYFHHNEFYIMEVCL